MPEEQTSLQPQANQPEPTKQLNIEPPTQGSKRWLWILIALVVLVLIGVGIWLITKKPATQTSKEPAKQATSAAKPKETKPERTKFAYVDSLNIWVLDIITKGKIQITSDGSKDILYSEPVFTDEDSFTYLKCFGSSRCELWRANVVGNSFTVKQIKKFSYEVSTYDIDKDQKTLVYFQNEANTSNKERLKILDLKSLKEIMVYEKLAVGRGIGTSDAFYVKISPDGNKVLLVDTVGGMNGEQIYGEQPQVKLAAAAHAEYPIVIWDVSGKKLAALTSGTQPVWKLDSKGIFYLTADGIAEYDLQTGATKKILAEQNISWPVLSPDGKYLAYNKGLSYGDMGVGSDSQVYMYDLISNKSTLVGDFSSASPIWVNDNYLVTKKLRKCADANECINPDLTLYVFEPILSVTNITTMVNYQVNTVGAPVTTVF